MSRDFRELLEKQWDAGNMLCVGLDSDLERIPEAARTADVRESIVGFNRAIIDATKDLVCAYKPNSAFYEAHGDEGWNALRETIQYLLEAAPGVPVIVDAKRGDIGSTNEAYAAAIFDHLHADAITVQPYAGGEALKPFLEREEKGVFVLCRTSNEGSGEFQDIATEGKKLYQVVAERVSREWDKNGNCGLVVGATYPSELRTVRDIVAKMPLLVPGIGAQGGDIEKTIAAGKDVRGRGLIVNVSRSLIFASSGDDFANAARTEAQRLSGAMRKAALQ